MARYTRPLYDYRDPACPDGFDPEAEQDEFDSAMEARYEAERDER